MEQKLLKRALLAAAFFASFLAAAPAARADVNFYSRFPDNVLADRLVASMSDEELLGQIFLLGYSGFTVTPELLAWIRDHGLGAVKIFGWNANNLSELTASISTMQRAAHGNRLQIPLIIATDQEGGWVRHIRGDTSITPGNMAIGATDLPEDAHRTGYYIGTELKALGINMDFAPTVDVYSNPHADVIGSRSFGSDPVRTGLLSVAFFRGLKQVGIISTAKHYPGHGAAGSDSHLTLPVIPASLNLLWDRDLVPYRFLIKEGIPAIMAGHLAYPQITGKVWPATLSRYFETQLLRERLGFQGLIVTDDLLMGGVQETGLTIQAICERAIQAGDDLLMLSQTPSLDSPVWTDLLARMHSDPDFRRLVADAARHVVALKAAYLRGPKAVPLYPSPESVRAALPDKPGEAFFFQQACRSVTLIAGSDLPLGSLTGKRVLLVGQFGEFLSEGKRRYPNADVLPLPYDPFYWATKEEVHSLLAIADHYQTIIFCLANPNSVEALKALKGTSARVVVISALSPVYLRGEPWVDSAIAVYGTGADSFAAGFAVLRGDFRPQGTLPIGFLDGEF